MIAPKFCFRCGKPLVKKYPHNDPENGPAGLRCPADHQTVEEAAHGYFSVEIVRHYLDELQTGGTDPYNPVPQNIREAAKLILEWEELEDEKHISFANPYPPPEPDSE